MFSVGFRDVWFVFFCFFGNLFIFCFDLDDEDVCYILVSGFVFLRFFVFVILNFKLFQMRNEYLVSDFILQKFKFFMILVLLYFGIFMNLYDY